MLMGLEISLPAGSGPVTQKFLGLVMGREQAEHTILQVNLHTQSTPPLWRYLEG